MPIDDVLLWLEDWCASYWTTDAKRKLRLVVGTLDNPGWDVRISCALTNTEGDPPTLLKVRRAEHDWLLCRGDGSSFDGCGGPLNLAQILEVFRGCHEPNTDHAAESDTREWNEWPGPAVDILTWLQAWYCMECNGDWEHQYGVEIRTLDTPAWGVRIDLADTAMESEPMKPVAVRYGEDDWLECRVENQKFQGKSTLRNLRELIRCFWAWVAQDDPNLGLRLPPA